MKWRIDLKNLPLILKAAALAMAGATGDALELNEAIGHLLGLVLSTL